MNDLVRHLTLVIQQISFSKLADVIPPPASMARPLIFQATFHSLPVEVWVVSLSTTASPSPSNQSLMFQSFLSEIERHPQDHVVGLCPHFPLRDYFPPDDDDDDFEDFAFGLLISKSDDSSPCDPKHLRRWLKTDLCEALVFAVSSAHPPDV
jgi:hypothetical protein